MKYTAKQKQEIIDKVCELISEGNSLRSITRIDKSLPPRQTINQWIREDKNIASQYARATEERAVTIFEDILDIADNQQDDIVELEDGRQVVNHNVIQRDKLRVDSRKWMLSKMMPKKYGDKLEVDQSIKGTISQDPLKIYRDILNETDTETETSP
jgi:hypothetical protein